MEVFVTARGSASQLTRRLQIADRSRAAKPHIHLPRRRIMQAQRDLQHYRGLIPTTTLPRRWTGAISMTLGVVFLSRSAYAQSADAEALFEQGNQLMADGKLGQSCDSFEASNQIEPRAGTLIRLGECREQNQQFA